MKFSISNLPFIGFRANILPTISKTYDIEIFYEFGTDLYWEKLLNKFSPNSTLTVHAPCVAINLADPTDTKCVEVYAETIRFATKYKAAFVVLHTNELWQGEKAQIQQLVEKRISEISKIALENSVQLLIENVGLQTNNSLLYDFPEYLALLDKFPHCNALIDTGHAHINGWDIPQTIQRLSQRLTALHLHDNDTTYDEHLAIGAGSIEWLAIFRALQAYAPHATPILEYADMNANKLDEHLSFIHENFIDKI